MDDKSTLQEWSHLLGIIEFESGSLSIPSKELLGKGRELADQLGVWLMAYSPASLSGQENEAILHGADLILSVPPPPSEEGSASDRHLMARAKSISNVIDQERPEIILFTSSPFMTAVAARVAQHFKTGLATDCTSLSLDLAERRLLATASLYEGRLLEEYAWPARRPQMAVLKSGAFPEAFPDRYREGKIKKLDLIL
jgi:electron transfer flavoprotein alpha subunit